MSDEASSHDDELGQLLSQALRARAATVEPEPDLIALAARIGGRRRGLGSYAAAAVVLLAAALGGIFGSLIASSHPQHTVLSSSGGSQDGPLPTRPHPDRTSAAGAEKMSPLSLSGSSLRLDLAKAPVTIGRIGGAGAHLEARTVWLRPVAVTSGELLSGCFVGQLVSTTAAAGRARTFDLGVIGLQPLSNDGLEVVDSSTAPAAHGEVLWSATVAVGPSVARVVAEEPDGVKDAMAPEHGLAVLGGLAPKSDARSFFSVDAEAGDGASLGALGFLMGSGSTAYGIAAPGAASAAGGCSAAQERSGRVTPAGSQPRAPLLASASVVAAVERAYGETDMSVRAQVTRIDFLSAGEAEVEVELRDGLYSTTKAVLGREAIWQVAS